MINDDDIFEETLLNDIVDFSNHSLFDLIIFSPSPTNETFIHDSLTCMKLGEQQGISLQNKKLYDTILLSKFMVQTLDYRDFINGYVLTEKDVNDLSKSCENLNEQVLAFELKNNFVRRLTLGLKKYEIVDYFKNLIFVEIDFILDFCKLTNIVSLYQTQSEFNLSWKRLLKYFSVLIHVHPLELGKICRDVNKKIDDVLKIADDPDLYMFEDTVLNPCATSLKTLCVCICTGVLKFETKDVISSLDNLISKRIC